MKVQGQRAGANFAAGGIALGFFSHPKQSKVSFRASSKRQLGVGVFFGTNLWDRKNPFSVATRAFLERAQERACDSFQFLFFFFFFFFKK